MCEDRREERRDLAFDDEVAAREGAGAWSFLEPLQDLQARQVRWAWSFDLS